MTGKRRPAAPTDLDAAGKRLWRAIVAEYELNPAELEALRQACHLLDQSARLVEAVAADELTVTGSKGQPAVNPLLGAVRQHADVILRLLQAVALPAPDEVEGRSPASLAAQRAARARWARRPGEQVDGG
jgi:P27 family predicted phage terminase small subunit